MHARRKLTISRACLCFALCLPLFNSCKDDYVYDNEEPGWLGSNLYAYLQESGRFNSYLALIDDLGHKETLSRTGSKTLFPYDDSAFARYFESKGITGSGPSLVHSLSDVEKRYLFNSSMLNMAYLDYMLSNLPDGSGGNSLGEGMAVRRKSAASYLDSITFAPSATLPATKWWNRFTTPERRGVYLADNGSRPIVHFTPAFLTKAGITEADWNILTRGQGLPYDLNGIYINGSYINSANKNITCKNGYIHVSNDAIVPLKNMAEIILTDEKTGLFGKLMDKFSAPYYMGDVNDAVKAFYLNGEIKDSVFVKGYFNKDAGLDVDPDGNQVSDQLLYYDPSDNNLLSNGDMGLMFVPNDQAMMEYWESEQGRFLRDVYGEWDNVPGDVLVEFIKNHQRRRLLSSLPHTWDIMTDEASFEMNVKDEDIVNTHMGCNGLVLETNRVYPPVDYQCVYAPTLTSERTKVMKKAIKDNDMKFYLYLRSMRNEYNLFVPTDEALQEYREPISWAIWANGGVDNREIWSFRLVDNEYVADVHSVNEDGTPGAVKYVMGVSSDTKDAERAIIKNRLNDLLDMHIVVADNEDEILSGYMDDGSIQFGLTKSGTVLKADGVGNQMQVTGGGNLEQGLPAANIVEVTGGMGRYITDNGHTYFIDRVLQDPFKSVYSAMQENEDYKAFLNLLMGNSNVFSYFQEDKEIEPIFGENSMDGSSGIGQVVNSFNNFRYTVLVPTKEALDSAFRTDKDLWTWEQIEMETDPTVKKERCLYLLNFLKYHFIDGMLPVAGIPFAEREYSTAARDENSRFERIRVKAEGSDLMFWNKVSKTWSKVVLDDAKDYNVLTRDYIVNNKDFIKADRILASSKAVLHLIDHVVDYQKK